MNSNYEIIRYKQGLSARIIIHSVNRIKLHWHKEIEILLVLKGNISINISGNRYELKEDDIFIVNANEVHSTISSVPNIVVAIQINPNFCYGTYPQLNEIYFDYATYMLGDNYSPIRNQIRSYIAKMIVEYNKSGEGYQLAIEGLLNSMMLLIVRNVPCLKEGNVVKENRDKDLSRITRIMEYISRHYTQKITLEDIANSEYLSVYYVSHFFKDRVGFSLKEYLNYYRLHKAVIQLDKTNDLISDIAIDNGFASVKAFNKSFMDFYNITPSEYRKGNNNSGVDGRDTVAYMDFDTVKAMDKLNEYIDIPSDEIIKVQHCDTKKVVVDTNITKCELNHYWKKLTTVGRAYDCLRADLQQQIAMATKELKFEYIRFHGIFSDEMRVVCENGEYNWQYTDTIIDFFMSINLRPFFDFTFMPTALCSNNTTVFWYKGNISMPNDLNRWMDLVDKFIRHCINRYGIHEVRLWYFEIWNEPDYMWSGTQTQYLEFFKATILTMLYIDKQLRIAGPSILQIIDNDTHWIDKTIKFINENDIELSYFTYHIYGETSLRRGRNSGLIPLLGDRYHVQNCIETFASKMKELKYPVKEVHITEFNISAQHQNYLLDTMFCACYIIWNAISALGKIDSLGFWTISDIFEEDNNVNSPFCGGFGMMTVEGIKKPSFYAYWFLNRLGNEIILRADDYIVTKKEHDIQILAFNYVFYDKLFLNGDRSMISYEKRSDVFEDKPTKKLEFCLQEMYGTYRMDIYVLDTAHGSAFDLYYNMGMPTTLSSYHVDYLRNMARPQLITKLLTLNGEYTHTIDLPPHAICMIIFEKQF